MTVATLSVEVRNNDGWRIARMKKLTEAQREAAARIAIKDAGHDPDKKVWDGGWRSPRFAWQEVAEKIEAHDRICRAIAEVRREDLSDAE